MKQDRSEHLSLMISRLVILCVLLCVVIALGILIGTMVGGKDVMHNDWQENDRYIVHDGYYYESLCDYERLDVSVEIADLILLGTIQSRALSEESERIIAAGPNFFYEIRVDAVYYDRHGETREGDILPFVSGFGYLDAAEYREKFPEKEPLAEGAVCACVMKNGLPLREGEQFVLMLDDRSMRDKGYWRDATWSQVWGVKDGGKKLYFGAEGKRYKGDLDGLIAELDVLIQARRGIMDKGITRWKEPD